MRRPFAIGIALVLCLAATAAQTPQAFEVVSIKPRVGSASDGPRTALLSPDRFTRPNATLRDLIRDAYSLPDQRIVGGPDWMNSSRYEVTAKASSPPSPDEMRRLVRRLLADRFALSAHMETRELPVFLLAVARDDGRPGPGLSRTTLDCAAILAERAKRGEAPAQAPKRGAERPTCATFTSMQTAPTATGVTITRSYHASGGTLAELAAFLSTAGAPIDRPVVDRTGLAGFYDISLQFTPSGARLNGALASDDGPSLFTSVREQLGLKLDASRAPIEVLVVDSAQPPTPD